MCNTAASPVEIGSRFGNDDNCAGLQRGQCGQHTKKLFHSIHFWRGK